MPGRSFAPLALAAAAACGEPPRPAPQPPPAAEFLVAAGDSTYWVTTAGGVVRVRRSPLFLARVGGRFHELYVVDAEEAYDDAVFAAQTMYARDLASGDSVAVLADSNVAAAADEYAAAHPGRRPLDDEEEAPGEPGTLVEAAFELVDVHGPYVTYELHLGAERAGEAPARETRRGVVDLRSGERATLARLFGEAAAARLVAEGRRLFAAAVDSVLAARDARARLAVDALGDFAFDETSFALADAEGAPAVAFLAPGAGSAGGLTLPLPPVAAPPPAPAWWREARATLPASSAPDERWPGPGYALVARYDPGDAVARLAIVGPAAPGAAPREWPVGRVQAPVYHVYALDRPPLDSAQARALRHAFDESVLYDEGARTARGPRRALAGPRVRLASWSAAGRPRRPVRRGARGR